MSKRILWKFVSWGLFALWGGGMAWANSPPEIANVTAAQRTDDSMLVDIGYDLIDEDADLCTVWVTVSDNRGVTWDVPAVSFTGAVGSDVAPGVGKQIVWDAAADLPGVYGTDYVVRVYADDGHVPPEGMTVVPRGAFEMGDHHDGMPEALPVHDVYLDAFYMDIHEVSNQKYVDALNWAVDGGLIFVNSGVVCQIGVGTAYCDTTISSSYSHITWDGYAFWPVLNKADHPVMTVTWFGAAAYANWLSAQEGLTPSYSVSSWECDFEANGYRLPTEAEWEYAARGGEYTPYYRCPWGNTIDGSKANYWVSGDPYETGSYPWTTPVGYYDGGQTPPGSDMANGYGLYDMAGNVWEWCNDWYGPYAHCDPPPCDNPQGPLSGDFRILRSSSWLECGCQQRIAIRSYFEPGYSSFDAGFRLVLACD